MNKPKVFISHIHEDMAVATVLSEYLRNAFSRAIEIFVSSDGSSILLGDKWFERIEENLRESSIVIVLASPDSVTRPWINFEAGGGWLHGARVMPVCIRGMQISALPQPLKTLQGCEISTSEGIQNFFEGIAKVLDLDCSIRDWEDVSRTLSGLQQAVPKDAVSRPEVDISPSDDDSSSWVYSLEHDQLAEVATSLLGLIGASEENLKKAGKEQGYWVLPTAGDYNEYNRCITALRNIYRDRFPFNTIPEDREEGGKTRPRSAAWLGTQCKGVLAFIMRNRDVETA